MNKILFFIVVSLGFLVASTACHKQAVPQQPVVHHTTDTVTITQVEVKLDTVIKTEADTLIIIDTINCNDAKVQVATKDGKVEASITKGVLRIKSVRHSKLVPITISKQVPSTERIRTEYKEVPVEVIKTKKVVPTWCWLLLIYNILALAWRSRYSLQGFLTGFKR